MTQVLTLDNANGELPTCPVTTPRQATLRGPVVELVRNHQVLVDLPHEFHLRQLESLDLDDDHALVSFVEQWGVPALLVPEPDGTYPEQAAPAYRGLPDPRPAAILRPDTRRRKRWEEAEADAAGDCRALDRIRWSLGVLQGFTKTWIAHSKDEPDSAYVDIWRTHGRAAVDGEDEALALLTHGVSWGLTSFSPRLVLVEAGDTGIDLGSDEPQHLGELPISIGERERVNLYAAVCALIANSVLDGSPAKRCKNRRCGAWFVRQDGRAQVQHRRKDVMYCSRRCANYVMQRKKRHPEEFKNRENNSD